MKNSWCLVVFLTYTTGLMKSLKYFVIQVYFTGILWEYTKCWLDEMFNFISLNYIWNENLRFFSEFCFRRVGQGSSKSQRQSSFCSLDGSQKYLGCPRNHVSLKIEFQFWHYLTICNFKFNNEKHERWSFRESQFLLGRFSWRIHWRALFLRIRLGSKYGWHQSPQFHIIFPQWSSNKILRGIFLKRKKSIWELRSF